MPIYCVTGYSRVLGDCCYVEAESRTAALEIVIRELRDELDEIDPPSSGDWEVIECNKPFFLILHRD